MKRKLKKPQHIINYELSFNDFGSPWPFHFITLTEQKERASIIFQQIDATLIIMNFLFQIPLKFIFFCSPIQNNPACMPHLSPRRLFCDVYGSLISLKLFFFFLILWALSGCAARSAARLFWRCLLWSQCDTAAVLQVISLLPLYLCCLFKSAWSV